MSAGDAHRTIEAIWRIESPKLIAGVARLVRDVGLAEELAQDAFVAALTQWSEEGVPRAPGAWLMAVAKRRAIDRLRREARRAQSGQQLAREHASTAANAPELDEDAVGDDLLRLIFIACHPVLSQEARVALTLRLLGGLSTTEIARAFLAPEATIAQRIVRAKRTLAAARVPFELPPRARRTERLASVLEVLYLIFNEGYAASAGDDVMRPALCADALRLGRVLAHAVPDEAEVHGLCALMELQSSRSRARVGAGGEPVLLLDQDRGRWDHVLIRRGFAALERAEQLSEGALGAYTLQAEIAAVHARARAPQATDWVRIAALYDALAQRSPSPVVELNRAVAVGMAYGPAAALELVDALAGEPALAHYHLLPAVRGDLLEKLGRFAEACAAFERAAAAAGTSRDRALFGERAARCRAGALRATERRSAR